MTAVFDADHRDTIMRQRFILVLRKLGLCNNDFMMKWYQIHMDIMR